MYKAILVPLDGSTLAENILTEVEELAVLLNAKLYLIYVSRAHVIPGVDPTNAQVRVVKEAQVYLESLKEKLSAMISVDRWLNSYILCTIYRKYHRS